MPSQGCELLATHGEHVAFLPSAMTRTISRPGTLANALRQAQGMQRTRAHINTDNTSYLSQAKFLHDLFDPFKSHAASLFTQPNAPALPSEFGIEVLSSYACGLPRMFRLSTHSAFVEGMVLPILNPQASFFKGLTRSLSFLVL